MAKTCRMCGTPNGDEIQFCAACGSALDGDQGQIKRGAPKGGSMPAKTMMFGVAPQAPAPQAQAPQAQAPQAGPPMIAMPGAPAAPAPAPAAAPMAKMPAKTMLGVQMAGAPTAAQPAAPAPMAQPAPMARPVQPAAAAQPAAAPAEAWRDKRTVLGMPAVVTEQIDAPAPQAAAPAPVAAPVPAPRGAHAETMPLEPQTKAAPSSRPPTARVEPIREAPRQLGRDEDWPDDEPPPRKRGGKGLLIIAIAAAGVLLVGAALLVYLLVFRSGSALQPQVFPSADGQTLTVVLAFPTAPVGAAVQVQGQTVPIMGGQARFDLPRGQMKLGDNPVQVAYLAPGAAPEAQSFSIALRYAIADDLAGLVTADPFVNVNFQLAEGVQLAIAGQPVQAASGGYSLKVPLSQIAAAAGEQAGDALLHRISFQITDKSGLTEQGQHVITIPTTKLQVDRPAANAIVAMEAVPCAGVTDEGAVVTINGVPAGVTAAGFHASVPLPAIGEHTVAITARAPGKAPRTETIKITRIQSLDAAVAEWIKDMGPAIDYPTLARDPNVQVGKKAKFRGRVVNISTERGVTAFLLYVGTGCPAGAKCAVYVAFRGETDAGLQSMVEVYGKVRGTWDVQLQGGKQETMPALDADYVIRADDAPSGQRRR